MIDSDETIMVYVLSRQRVMRERHILISGMYFSPKEYLLLYSRVTMWYNNSEPIGFDISNYRI